MTHRTGFRFASLGISALVLGIAAVASADAPYFDRHQDMREIHRLEAKISQTERRLRDDRFDGRPVAAHADAVELGHLRSRLREVKRDLRNDY